jgi:TetR/AcrR family transcriptional regulator, cholesterol catabolism regulator
VPSPSTSSMSREDILTAAEALFERFGYHGTSMRQLADAIGLKAGSLYSHISSKEELLCAIVDRIAWQILAACRSAGEMNASPRERLRAFIIGHLECMARQPKMANVLLLEWRSLPPARKEAIRKMRDETERILAKIITDGQKAGEFRSVEVKWIRFVLLSAVNWTSQWFDPKGPNTPEEIADGFLDVILSGINSQRATISRSASSGVRRLKKV